MIHATQRDTWRAFRHYKPRSQKVFGVVAVSPNKRILLVQGRCSGKWSFPKGHLDGCETGQECALRECIEETGIAMSGKPYTIRKLYAGEYFFYKTDHEEVSPKHDKNEISEVGWFTLDEIRSLKHNADILNLISRINSGKLVDENIV